MWLRTVNINSIKIRPDVIGFYLVATQNIIRVFFGNAFTVGLYFVVVYLFVKNTILLCKGKMLRLHLVDIVLVAYIAFNLLHMERFDLVAIKGFLNNVKFIFYFYFFRLSYLNYSSASSVSSRSKIVDLIIILFAAHIVLTGLYRPYWEYFIVNNLNEERESNFGQFLAIGFFQRGYGFDLTPVDSGFFCAIAAIYFYYVDGRRFNFKFLFIAVCLFMTFNRTASMIFVIFVMSRLNVRTIFVLLFSIFLLGVMFVMLNGNFADKLTLLFSFSDASAMQRVDVSLPKAMSLISAKPLWGWGVGSTYPIQQTTLYVENNYLVILIELGFFGLLLFLSSLIAIVAHVIGVSKHNNHPEYVQMIVFALCVVVLASVSLVPFNSNTVMLIFNYVLTLPFRCQGSPDPEAADGTTPDAPDTHHITHVLPPPAAPWQHSASANPSVMR